MNKKDKKRDAEKSDPMTRGIPSKMYKKSNTIE